MTNEQELEALKAREDYENGKQPRDEHGDRLWLIVDRLYYAPNEEAPWKMWECQTAEGPVILALLELNTGISRLQVQDGSPERRDACADRFVLDMQWSDFCWGWQTLGDALQP